MRQPALSACALLAVGVTLLFSTTARADDAPIASDPAVPPAPAPLGQTSGQPPSQGVATAPPVTAKSCKTDACASDCACAQRCCAKCGCKSPKLQLSVTGLRASFTSVNTGLVKDNTVGLGFAGAADAYALDGTTHATSYFMLGGGQGGFEGALAGTIDIGYRIPVAEDHGPFGRIGFDGRIQGNDLLYFSLVELPRVTLGYQYLHGKTVVEAGGRGGAILAGLYDPSYGGRRKLNGFEWGGFASAQIDFLKVDVSFMRIEANKTLDGTPVDVGRAQLCGVGGSFGVCLDGMLFRGHADLRNDDGQIHDTTAQYLGLTIGWSGW